MLIFTNWFCQIKKKCSDIANELGIVNFFSEQLPSEKLEKIKNLNYKEKMQW